MNRALIVGALVVGAGTAAAQAPAPAAAPAVQEPAQTAQAAIVVANVRPTTISVELAGFTERGLIVDVERDLAARHVSIDGGIVLRSSAGGDYTSSTVGVGVEVRYWFRRRAIWTDRPRGSAVGWYVGGRIDLARTSLSMNDTSLGIERQLGGSLLGGYRFAPWRGLEIRPYTGIAARREWDAGNRLAAWTRGGLVLGFAAGWAW